MTISFKNNKKLNILFSHYAIIDKEGFGRSFMLAKELAILGNELTFLTSLPVNQFYFPYKKEIRDGVLIIAFPDIIPNFMRRTGFGLLCFLLKIFFIFSHKYDIYHSDAGHRPCGGIPILLKKIFFNITYICEWWDYFGIGGQYDSKKGIKKYTQGMYDLFFEIKEKKIANGVVCLSAAMAERAKKEGISESKICVINGGSDVRNISFINNSKYREKYGIQTSSLVFGFIGMNEGEINDIIPFIDALNELSSQNIINNSVLLTTGRYIPEKVKKHLNLKFKVRELGWVEYEKFGEILNCVDLFVLLQKNNLENETRWPNKLGDYIAAGRKIIINPYGETKHLAEKYNKLFIEVSYDKESIKEKLSKIVKNGGIYSDREEIRKIAEKELSWEQKGKQLYGFYKKIIKSNIKN